MKIPEAIDRNKELTGELVREGRLEKAHSVQLANEALIRITDNRKRGLPRIWTPLPGETRDESWKGH